MLLNRAANLPPAQHSIFFQACTAQEALAPLLLAAEWMSSLTSFLLGDITFNGKTLEKWRMSLHMLPIYSSPGFPAIHVLEYTFSLDSWTSFCPALSWAHWPLLYVGDNNHDAANVPLVSGQPPPLAKLESAFAGACFFWQRISGDQPLSLHWDYITFIRMLMSLRVI